MGTTSAVYSGKTLTLACSSTAIIALLLGFLTGYFFSRKCQKKESYLKCGHAYLEARGPQWWVGQDIHLQDFTLLFCSGRQIRKEVTWTAGTPALSAPPRTTSWPTCRRKLTRTRWTLPWRRTAPTPAACSTNARGFIYNSSSRKYWKIHPGRYQSQCQFQSIFIIYIPWLW